LHHHIDKHVSIAYIESLTITIFKPMFKHHIQELLSSKDQAEIQKKIEGRLEYAFTNKELILTALVHRSMVVGPANEPVEHNERFEFLGDSVLNFMMTDFLFKNFPQLDEGELSKRKAVLVSTGALAECSRELSLGEFIQIGASEEKGGGRDRTSILADLFESILGAIYQDGGVNPCLELFHRILIPKMDSLLDNDELHNYKSDLLEALQSRALGQPEYKLAETRGLEHEKIFVIEAFMGEVLLGKGEGSSKKIAQQKAAKDALSKTAWL
jgi:ribonuclease-3